MHEIYHWKVHHPGLKFCAAAGYDNQDKLHFYKPDRATSSGGSYVHDAVDIEHFIGEYIVLYRKVS